LPTGDAANITDFRLGRNGRLVKVRAIASLEALRDYYRLIGWLQT
jgi:hypothetical protein